MTLEEYEKVLEEKRKALQALKTESSRKVDVKEFETMQQLSNKKTNHDVFIKLVSPLTLRSSYRMNLLLFLLPSFFWGLFFYVQINVLDHLCEWVFYLLTQIFILSRVLRRIKRRNWLRKKKEPKRYIHRLVLKSAFMSSCSLETQKNLKCSLLVCNVGYKVWLQCFLKMKVIFVVS